MYEVQQMKSAKKYTKKITREKKVHHGNFAASICKKKEDEKWNVAFDKLQHVWPWFWCTFQTFNFEKAEESILNSNNN